MKNYNPERTFDKEDAIMNKEIYESPEMNVVTFESEDIIRTSGGVDDGSGGGI